MNLTADIQASIVAKANRAPSVHNTQPSRWAFEDEGVQIYADKSRFLDIGDPTLQDAGLSCGAALEGTVMALADHDIHVSKVENFWDSKTPGHYADMRLAAKVTMGKGAKPDPLSDFVGKRFTWRGSFEKAQDINPLLQWAKMQEDITLVSEPQSISQLATLNDLASLKFFKNKAYRQELVAYMRLSKKHPLWDQDGLNRESMHLSSFEGAAANILLRHPMFEIMNAVGLGKAIVSEASKTTSATAIVFFTVPKETSPLDMGRSFYRRWLEITALGYAVWPMAVIADDPDVNALCHKQYNIASHHKIINVFRIGRVPEGTTIQAARLKNAELILSD